MDFRPWPGRRVIALICCRKGDPYFNWSPGVKEEACYCCSSTIMVSQNNQNNKETLGSEAEFICINCWHDHYSGQDQVLIREQLPPNPLNN